MKAQALTVPNALSGLRLLLVPVVAWLVWSGHHDRIAAALLFVAGCTDWLDGWIARKWNQVSALGTLLDPLADRLALICVASALAARGVVPVWMCAGVVARDALLATWLPRLRRAKKWALPVTQTGKAGTFALLTGLPMIYLAEILDSEIVRSAALVILAAGVVVYWLAGFDYIRRIRTLARTDEASSIFRGTP
jgi:cardiolipin synthase